MGLSTLTEPLDAPEQRRPLRVGRRVPAIHVGTDRSENPAAVNVYRVHPLLDPLLPSHHLSEARRWFAAYRAIAGDPGECPRLMRAFISPVVGDAQAPHQSIESYFQDADQYLDDLLCFASPADRQRLRPLPETRDLLDFGMLLRTTFEAPEPRARYEAQRKLYLTKLLFDIDHCRSVRDGTRHRAMFEGLLHRSLWALERRTREVTCRVDAGGACVVRADPVGAGDAAGFWRFDVRDLALPNGEGAIDVYHHHVRFKREPAPPGESLEGAADGAASPCWPASRRRSGSILSKMIRKGIGDPHLITDILGAVFVVGDRRQAYALERTLVQALGGPFRWRDRVDTLSGERDRARLDDSSAIGFRVLKQIVDVLVEDRSAVSPYLFPVEVQIFRFDDYLLTRSGADFAGHVAYKRRQFASGLFPILFPAEVYRPVDEAVSQFALEEASAETGAG
jgi:hypothetical protein